MTDTAWFYCTAVPAEGTAFELSAEEAVHLVRSRRIFAGSRATVFDGAGTVALVKVESADTRPLKARLRVYRRSFIAAPRRRIHLACALPKGDRQSILIDMVTQLGVNAYTPIRFEHSVVSHGSRSSERWRRVMREACKQSRRAWLPELQKETTLTALVEAVALAGFTKLVADPGGGAISEFDSAALKYNDMLLVVGPEGGLSDNEKQLLYMKGVTAVCLCDAILRVETAAAALVALVSAV
ncbi:MAG: 16S rRNA (uracil(1498)-N(3))-methyltransferase [Pseudomonadota bacterium]|nr:16S rRNA (uracil(1498)-N(3))-methyltransferase [Pseudomonadota bacterium]